MLHLIKRQVLFSFKSYPHVCLCGLAFDSTTFAAIDKTTVFLARLLYEVGPTLYLLLKG